MQNKKLKKKKKNLSFNAGDGGWSLVGELSFHMQEVK